MLSKCDSILPAVQKKWLLHIALKVMGQENKHTTLLEIVHTITAIQYAKQLNRAQSLMHTDS